MAKSENSDGSQSSQANTDAFEAAIAISALHDSMSRTESRRRVRSRYCGGSTSMVGQKSWGPKMWKGRVAFIIAIQPSALLSPVQSVNNV